METVLFGETAGEDDVGDVVFDFFVHIDFFDDIAGMENVRGFEDGVAGVAGGFVAVDLLVKDLAFFFFLRIADYDFEHETVHLGFGQRVGTFLFDGVLGSHHEEGLFEREGVFADGYLTFLHGFEKSALDFGGSAVDFVGEDEIGKDGTLFDVEGFVFLTIDHGA